MKTRLQRAVPRYALSFILAFSLCLPTAGLAYASPDDESDSSTQVLDTETAQASSPCIPSEEDIAKWEADGTLDDRIAFQESLGNGEVSSSLIAQAKEQSSSTSLLRSNSSNIPGSNPASASMSTTGNAKVLALRVDFPVKEPSVEDSTNSDEALGSPANVAEGNFETLGFSSDDSLQALQNLVNPAETLSYGSSSDAANVSFSPYDSLSAYYQRSSYGSLNIAGKAYNYIAQHARDYYTSNIGVLFAEALASLDNTINYADYDANHDGYIDAVYIHFAGGNASWGTTWWSNCSTYTGTEVKFDDKQIGRIVTLHLPSNTEEGVRTAIHETGHVLGLPDYYSYNAQLVEHDPSWRTGILTFDMMNNNIGDHNAYSKWLLGWIPESAITRIVANEDGITVMKGTEVTSEIKADGNTEPSVEEALSLLATNDSKNCGGFIAISDDKGLLDQDGLFSSFYLLEYNGYEGNQIVKRRVGFDSENQVDITAGIPYGFRMFRIQAELNESGSSFIHENKNNDVHNQFIELVDHDAYKTHFSVNGMADGAGTETYGCMMLAGDYITSDGVGSGSNGIVSSYPSTNFYESINRGFTGLSIEVLETNENQGTVKIGYSDESKPDLSPDSLTLSQTNPRAVSNVDAFELTASIPLVRNSNAGIVFIKAKGTQGAVTVEDVSGSSLTLSYAMPPELFVAGETCEIIFPAGYFLIGIEDGKEIYSNKIRVSLTVANDVQVEKAGDYDNAASDKRIISNVITTDTGMSYFAVSDNSQIVLCKLDPNDPTKVSTGVVNAENSAKAYDIKLEPLADGKICLITSAYVSNYGTQIYAHWVNPDSLAVEAKHLLSANDLTLVSSYQDSLITACSFKRGNESPQGFTISVYTLDEDGIVEEKRDIQNAGALFEVANSNGKIAISGYRYSENASIVKIVDGSSLTEWSSNSNEVDFNSIQANATLDITGFSSIAALAYNEGQFLGITHTEPAAVGSPDTTVSAEFTGTEGIASVWRDSSDFKTYLVSFGSNGLIESSNLFCASPSSGTTVESLTISPAGIPVAELTLGKGGVDNGRRLFFFRDGVESDPVYLSNDSSASGTWLYNDAWLEIGLNFPNSNLITEEDSESNQEDIEVFGSSDLSGTNLGEGDVEDAFGSSDETGEGELIGSSYEGNSRPVHYLIAFLPSEGGEGGGSVEPSPDPVPGNGNGNTLSNTGDATGLMAIGCAVAAIAAIVVAVLAFRASRKKR